MADGDNQHLEFMRLLMITRKVDKNDPLAGFVYNWVLKIGQAVDELRVIAWQKGDISDLPENIKVFNLTKKSKIGRIMEFKKLVFKNIRKIDGLFCHMNPEYTILAAPIAKLFSRKVVSWYAHKAVNWKLYLVNLLTDKILTASEESCRLKNRKKIEVAGHGINVDKFKVQSSKLKVKNSKFKILSIGRISPIKDYETLIKAVDILVKDSPPAGGLEVQIIGGPGLKEHKTYFKNLKKMVSGNNLGNYIKFIGPVPHREIQFYYENCDLFINLSQTGSVDKSVLEAMACEKIVLTSNEAFVNILNNNLMVEENNPKFLTEKIKWVMNLDKEAKKQIQEKLRAEVVKNHNLDNLVVKIIEQFK